MKAIFVGSFDPFTTGHEDIVRRALKIFDGIAIGVGVNPDKKYMYTAEERVAKINDIFRDDDRVTAEAYSDYTIDFARRHGVSVIVKGLRNAEDFDYELFHADYNRKHGDLETVFLTATPELRHISSTFVKSQMK